MHEATIAQSILNIAFSKLEQTPHANAVTAIHVIIGEFRNAELDSLKFAFDNLKLLNEKSRNCALKAEVVNSRAVCRSGGHLYHPDFEHAFRCPQCGGGIGKLLCGEELDIIGITLQAEEVSQGAEEVSYEAEEVSQESEKFSREAAEVSREVAEVSCEAAEVSREVAEVSHEAEEDSHEVDEVSQEVDEHARVCR